MSNNTIAAVDLGSNSFHMIIARVDEDGQLTMVDRMKESVRLASGLDAKGNLSDAAIERALACLKRFGQRLSQNHSSTVRAVGTNTLRQAHNSESFLIRATLALGHGIEIIAGREEARLIYLGVAHSAADDGGQRLVVDIGGGSTECIIGERFETLRRESLYMGCVSYTQRFFRNGELTEHGFHAAEIAASLEVHGIREEFQRKGWQDCFGASGTIKAVGKVLLANGWSDGEITAAGLRKLRRAMIKSGSLDALALDGLSENRRPVLAGGVAVLRAVIDGLGIDRMKVAGGALREGLLYDLLGRLRHEDVRELTVQNFVRRFKVNAEIAARVSETAALCMAQVEDDWNLRGLYAENLLHWAALLHKAGLIVAHNQFHKHGAYMIRHADMRGFSRQDQALLAFLIRAHRRKFPVSDLEQLPEAVQPTARSLAVLLRLAVLLNHGRTPDALPEFTLTAVDEGLEMRFPGGWLDAHPLTGENLAIEANYLSATGLTFSYQ